MKKFANKRVFAIAICLVLCTVFMTACSGTSAPVEAQGTYENGNRYIKVYESTVDFVRVYSASGDITKTDGTFEYDTSAGTVKCKFGTTSYSGTIDTSAKSIKINGITYTRASSSSESSEVEEDTFAISEE